VKSGHHNHSIDLGLFPAEKGLTINIQRLLLVIQKLKSNTICPCFVRKGGYEGIKTSHIRC
jgi:hypothetical protein